MYLKLIKPNWSKGWYLTQIYAMGDIPAEGEQNQGNNEIENHGSVRK